MNNFTNLAVTRLMDKHDELNNSLKSIQSDLAQAMNLANELKINHPADFSEINESTTVLTLMEMQREIEGKQKNILWQIDQINDLKNKLQMDSQNLSTSKALIIDKWGDLLLEKFQSQNTDLNGYLDFLINQGTEVYGDNFITDVINENGDNFGAIESLLDEVSKAGKQEVIEPEESAISESDDIQIPEEMEAEEVSNEEIGNEPSIEEVIDEEVIPEVEGEIVEEEKIPSTAICGVRREAKPSLIKKFKTKWHNLSTKKKVITVLGVIIAGGIATAAIIASLNGDTTLVNQSNEVVSSMNQVGPVLLDDNSINPVDLSNNLDYSNITEGSTIYSTADNAVNQTNQLTANEWIDNSPLDVYDTSKDEYMNLSQAQLQDEDFMLDLAKDGDKALLVGGEDMDGFVNLEDVISRGRGGR